MKHYLFSLVLFGTLFIVEDKWEITVQYLFCKSLGNFRRHTSKHVLRVLVWYVMDSLPQNGNRATRYAVGIAPYVRNKAASVTVGNATIWLKSLIRLRVVDDSDHHVPHYGQQKLAHFQYSKVG